MGAQLKYVKVRFEKSFGITIGAEHDLMGRMLLSGDKWETYRDVGGYTLFTFQGRAARSSMPNAGKMFCRANPTWPEHLEFLCWLLSLATFCTPSWSLESSFHFLAGY